MAMAHAIAGATTSDDDELLLAIQQALKPRRSSAPKLEHLAVAVALARNPQLLASECSRGTSGGLSSAAVGRAYLRTCKRRWVLQRSSPMRKWRRVACGSTPRMLFGPLASSSLTMWHMKAGQHKRLPGVGFWVRPSK